MEGHSSQRNAFCWRRRAFTPPTLHWSPRALRVFFAAVFLIAFPLYLFFGFQPALPADAAEYPVLSIPSLNLSTPVSPVELVDHQLTTPAYIAGSFSQHPNKTLLIGHSSTVFKTLHRLTLHQSLTYADETYLVTKIETLEKSAINMTDILASAPTKTLIIMTCAGDPLPNQDATHRLIVTAELQ